jgi:hypothetical protein
MKQLLNSLLLKLFLSFFNSENCYKLAIFSALSPQSDVIGYLFEYFFELFLAYFSLEICIFLKFWYFFFL